MATYNLDSTTFNPAILSLLSPDVASAISYTLSTAGLPEPGSPNSPVPGSVPGPTTIGSGLLFVYSGPNGTTSDVTTGGGDVLATGYMGGSIVDSGPGGDTLVGGDTWGTTLQVTMGNNTLFGGHGMQTLIGGSGNDVMWGGGLSSMVAGTGNDTIHGGQTTTSSDTLVGGPGMDILGVAEGNNVLVAGSGPNTLYGGAGNDTMWGGADAWLQAGTGNAVMHGGATATDMDTLVAGPGNDTMGDANGSNMYYGSTGSDTLWLGAGNDSVYGSFGSTSSDQVHTSAAVGNATVFGGTNTQILETNTQASIASNNVVGGVTEITFSDGQQLDAKGATISFSGGGSIKT